MFQVSADEGIGKQSKLVEFCICASVIGARKTKHLDVTTMFTYSHANNPLGQSECAYYRSYFINVHRSHFLHAVEKYTGLSKSF